MAVYVSPGGMYNVHLSNFIKAKETSISLKLLAILLMENKTISPKSHLDQANLPLRWLCTSIISLLAHATPPQSS